MHDSAWLLFSILATDVDLGEFVCEDRALDYFDTLWREPALDPRPLLTQEMLKKSHASKLGYDVIGDDIFNDLKWLFIYFYFFC